MSEKKNRRTAFFSVVTVVLSCGILLLPAVAPAEVQGHNHSSGSMQEGKVPGRASRLPYDLAAPLLTLARDVAISLPHYARVLPLRMIAVSHFRGGEEASAKAVFEEARTAAKAIEDEYLRNFALSTLAVSQAEVSLFEEARATAAVITDESRFPDVADALQSAGDYAGAREVIQRIPSSDTLFHNRLAKLAVSQAKAGDISGAHRAARQIGEQFARNRALEEICTIVAATGNFEEALSIAATIEDSHSQKSAKRAIAIALVASGRTNDALKLARTMNESYVLTEVSEAQIKASDIAGGKRTAQEALAFAQAKGESEWNRVVPVIDRLIEVDDIEGARDLLSRVTSEEVKAECEKRLIVPEALRLVKSGNLKAGLARLSTLDTKDARESAKLDTIEHLIGVNDFEGAVTVIDIMDKTGFSIFRNSALRKLAIAQADSGDLLSASGTIEKISSPRSRQFALRHLLKLQLNDGDLVAAMETARRVPTFQEIHDESGWRPSMVREFTVETALYEVAEEQRTRGHFVQARATAQEIGDKDLRTLMLREITASEAAAAQEIENKDRLDRDRDLQDPSARNRALEKIALTKASSGDLEGALDTIHQIEDNASVRIHVFDSSMSRAGALSRIGRSLIITNQFKEGVRFIGEALKLIELIENVGQRQMALVETIEILER